MSVSPCFNNFLGVKLYTNYTGGYDDFDTSALEPGLFVYICIAMSQIDLCGGVHKSEEDNMIKAFWVEIIEKKGNRIAGRVSELNPHFQVGSIFRFEADTVVSMRGSLQWNIEHLTVLVSEKIAHHGEDVGYFYPLEMEPWSFNKIFYARTELYLTKETIPLVEIPLSALIAIDPKIYLYLEVSDLKGLIRIDDNTFKEFDLAERDESIFPLDYICTVDEESTNNFENTKDDF